MQTDFLIIGQGLAGSLLAWVLKQRGSRVMVVDNGHENASRVAAGIINPVTGIRLVKTADASILVSAASDCYSRLSAFFGQTFYTGKPMLRIFRDDFELAQGIKRLKDVDYQPYISDLALPGRKLGNLSTAHGYLWQNHCGYLSTAPLLACLKQFFTGQNAYRQADVSYQTIECATSVRWRDITAQQVIFCEGYHAWQNPWFSWLPFRPAKGEILTLAQHCELPDAIINYGQWLLPLSSGEMRTGATFDRASIDTESTRAGRTQLLNGLKSLTPDLAQPEVLQQHAGIRPCTADRHPFIGQHPEHKQLAIFNGFGAKGSLQIPWYSLRFADYLLTGKPLPAACDIQRYRTAYCAG